MTRRQRLVILGAALLVGSGLAFVWRAGASDEDAYERTAAYAALASTGRSPEIRLEGLAILPLPSKGRARARAAYWAQADRIRLALTDPALDGAGRTRLLRVLARDIVAGTAHGSASTRAQALTLAAFARIAEMSLSKTPPGHEQLERSAGLLRRAIELDPSNSDAKANLELLLQAFPGLLDGSRSPSDTSQKKQGANSQAITSGAAGSGDAAPPGGY